MILTNRCNLPGAWTMGFRRDGRELLIVIVKATFGMPAPGSTATLLEEQVPLVEADVFTGEPGFSAPRFETDFAHHKPACDVLLVGSAYAPAGQPVSRCSVSLHVGSMLKRFVVVGPRAWQKRLGLVKAGDPELFEHVALSYDLAWGGTDRTLEHEGRTYTYRANPAGQGYWRYTDNIEGQPLPQTEEVGRSVDSHRGNYVPQAFSPRGRNWQPRYEFAGTYDAKWLASRAPLWPDDFDERYFQAAPADQIIPYPVGGEPVELRNLTPDGHLAFALPSLHMPVTFIPHKGRDLTRQANIDTIVFEPDEGRFTMTWRNSLAMERSVFDIKEVIVGQMPETWHRARRFPGKPYYAGLGEAVRARRGRSIRR